MNRTALRALGAVLCLLALGYVGRGLYGELHRFKEADWAWVPAMLALYFLARLMGSEALRSGLIRQGHRVRHGEAFLLILIHTYTSLLIPRAGLGVSALYLKRRHGLPVTGLAMTMLPITVAQVTSIGVAGLLCLSLLVTLQHQALDITLTILFSSMTVAGVAAFSLRNTPFARFGGRFGDLFRRLDEAWHVMRTDRPLIALFHVQYAVGLVLRGLRLYVAFLALGIEANFLGVMLASLVAEVMALLNLTPGALGLREAGVAYAATSMGVTAPEAVAVTLFDRAVWTVGVVVVAQFGTWRLTRGSPLGDGDSGGRRDERVPDVDRD